MAASRPLPSAEPQLAPASQAPAVPGELILGSELLAWRRQRLGEGGRAADLDWLLDLGAGLRWTQLQRVWLDPASPVQLHTGLGELTVLWRQHLECHTPLQYLVGVCPWREFSLAVSPAVLIPRQETEVLADLALALALALPAPAHRPLTWADLGTGSGCLALALARAAPKARGLAVDCSAQALAQAEINLEDAGLLDRVTLHLGQWWEPLRPHWGGLDLVVSNPPYIPTAVLVELEPLVREHEPHLALDGGPDGLEAIRALASGAWAALAPGGWLLLEHHHDQSDAVAELLLACGLVEVTSHRDLEGRWRFAQARRPMPGSRPAWPESNRPPLA
ncbi:peptide chain release factor N(5)-glutamine methyltransferase [Synechococcus sp. EJ6-Ellesmere]|uniref:peptide chain release factor N(5)-glutamine methyltransferase n=1 Tax=Synechococcus sp. EJ6-Ellesmere TaxID=2823734 RepID=UPI0020CC6823|nr:peptide chain release factor N(5)-glutamine methyltransferase [Synechococcus sp. EJ6-Ellesmere]MCP9825297.1 peptide chain release factor N(5)-glutamine methyltransferase [Synechococcus sp. EJ6-Ellesmere]